MMGEGSARWGRAPLAAVVAPLNAAGESAVGGLMVGGAAGEQRWRHFDSSVNAVSFGFVATAILVAMFLVMAIFERFLQHRPDFSSPPEGGWSRRPWRCFGRNRRASDLPSEPEEGAVQHRDGGHHPHHPQQTPFNRKLDSCPSPKMSVYAKEVSVLMPGQDIPTFIAHPAPAPCSPERIAWPSHQQISPSSCTSNPS